MKWKWTFLSLLLMFSISISAFAMDNGLLFFSAPNEKATEYPTSGDRSIWVSDGTPNGTVMIVEGTYFIRFIHHNMRHINNINGNFICRNFRSDGTKEGSIFYPYDKWGNYPSPELSPEGWLYSLPTNTNKKNVLWRTDGSINDPETGFFGEVPGLEWANCGTAKFGKTTLIFQKIRKGKNNFVQIWKSNGTSDGTVKLGKKIFASKNIYNGMQRNQGLSGQTAGNKFFIWLSNPKRPEHKWLFTIDGTPNGNRKVRDRHPRIYYTENKSRTEFNFKDKYIFTAETYKKTDPSLPDIYLGEELWCSNGTRKGTFLFRDIYWGKKSSDPMHFTRVGDQFFFYAQNHKNGRELWKSDGTRKGTKMVKDIFPGRQNGVGYFNGFYDPSITPVGNQCYFWAYDGIHGFELWRSDGTEMGTVMVKDINQTDNGCRNLAADSGAALASNRQETLMPVITENDLNEFSEDDVDNDDEYGTNNMLSSTVDDDENYEMRDQNIEMKAQRLGNQEQRETKKNRHFNRCRWIRADDKGNLFFFADDGVHGFELWRSDGTETGTYLVKDLNPGKEGLIPRDAVLIDNIFYFTFFTKALGNVLWKSDGTERGTIQVKRMSGKNYPNSNSSEWDLSFSYVEKK